MSSSKVPPHSDLETMIAYSGDSDAPAQIFDLALFKQLNAEFASKPVVPAPRPMKIDYGMDVGTRRGEMLDRKIGIRGKRVLEVGCGASAMSRVLAGDAFGCSMVGVDISSYDDWARPVNGELDLRVHDITQGDNSALGTFDRIVSFAVFEHVVHPHAALEAVYELLNPGGRAYIYANLYRGAKASHRYREVYFPWPHLLFENSVWREFYTELQGEPSQPAWVNKWTYDQYVNTAGRLGFNVLEHFPSAPFFDEEFYMRFAYELAAYPKFDLMHDFIHLIVEKPDSVSSTVSNRRPQKISMLDYPPQKAGDTAFADGFWARVEQEQPEWLRYKDDWLTSRTDGASSMNDALPWVTFAAIDFLKSHVRDHHIVFEWGSGGSTLFFKDRTASLTSIEHDQGWAERVSDVLPSADPSVTFELVEPVKADGRIACGSGSRGHETSDFSDYVSTIDRFDDATLDFVIVDGRARMACLERCLNKVAPGGFVMLDNANYPRYANDIKRLRSGALSTWTETNLAGPGPCSRTPCWETTVWQRPLHDSQVARPSIAGRVAELREAVNNSSVRAYDQISYFMGDASPADVDAALRGDPYAVAGFEFQLTSEHKWIDPTQPRTKQLCTQAWDFLEPIFKRHSSTQCPKAFDRLLGTVESWLSEFGERPISSAHPSGNQPASGVAELDFFAADTAISNRFFRLGYVFDIAARNRDVPERQLTQLADAYWQHGLALQEDENFSPHHNHGFFQALAQVCGASRLLNQELGAYFSETKFDLAACYAQGCERLDRVIQNIVSSDGVLHDHSCNYQILVSNALGNVVDAGLLTSEVALSARDQMSDAAAWMFDSRGRIANLGDTDLDVGEPGIASEASTTSQLVDSKAFMDGGFWFVRGETNQGPTYVAQTSCFHSRAHKQADTSAFLWRDRNMDILVDAGRYGYVGRTEVGSDAFKDGFWYSDPRRMYVESSRAHNTVQIAGQNHPRFRAAPFGSSLRATATRNGIFASETAVPNLQGTVHFRNVIVRPGHWLICLDTARSSSADERQIRQNFHIHPDWTLSRTSDTAIAYEHSDGAELFATSLLRGSTIVDTARGRGSPETDSVEKLFGWWSPGNLLFEPCNAVTFETTGAHVTMATLFSFSEATIDPNVSSFNVTRRRLRFRWKSENGTETVVLERGKDGKGQATLEIKTER